MKTKSNHIRSPHDKLFKASMSHPEVAHDFLSTHLPAHIIKKIDFKALDILPNTFIDEELKLAESDVLIKTTIEKQNGYIYILAEHQSTQDHFMPLRLIKYMIKIWEHDRQHHHPKKSNHTIPVIFPLVFYTGASFYKGPRALWELCGEQSKLMQDILAQPFHLIDVNTIPENILTARIWSGTMEFMMRHRFRQHISTELEKIALSFNQLLLEDKGHFVLQLLSYIMAIDNEHRSTKELALLMKNKVSPKMGDKIMSLAEILIEEGIENNKLETARDMLIEGCDPVFVAKITKLPLDKIKALQKSLS